MGRDETEFVVYIINEIANAKNKYPSQVYEVLEKTDCIKSYLVPLYDVLHTMSSQSVVEDVLEYIKVRGESI